MGQESGLEVLTEIDVEVPMRDGTILRGNLFRPTCAEPVPALVMRTPYRKPATGFDAFCRRGYAVLTQDVRGRYASDGEFRCFYDEHTGDAEDGFDTVEWAAAQSWCNGRVGTFGCSYNAWMQWQLAKLRPPHLQAMAAYSIPQELFGVDYTGGFRPARRLNWLLATIAPDMRKRLGLPAPNGPEQAQEIFHRLEHDRWLWYLPYGDLPKFLPSPLAEQVAAWFREPTAAPWKFAEAHHEVAVPNLDFSGWYDHCNDTMHHLRGMQQHGWTEVARTQSRMILGPWSHVTLGNRKTGDIDFGEEAALNLNETILRWFDYWLKDQENGVPDDPILKYYVLGSGEWKTAPTWPLEETLDRTLYLHSQSDARAGATHATLTDAPCGNEPVDTFSYDPRNPLPTLWGANFFTEPADRSKLSYRDDLLVYRTLPLTKPIEVVGYPEVVLWIASSCRDTDFFVWLVDEQADGVALDIASGMLKARHRNGLERCDLLIPGEPTELRIKLGATACRFLPGHRLRLEISSSDFPNYDRNHNTGGNDFFETELVTADQVIFHDTHRPSRVILPTMPVD